MRICRSCGASVSSGVSWCPQCHAGLDAPPPAGLPVPAPSLGGRPLPTALRTYARPEPSSEAVTSRWRGGTTTFGPLGRILLTAGIVLVGVMVYGAMGGTVNPLSVPFVGMYAVGAIRWLFVVWSRRRVA